MSDWQEKIIAAKREGDQLKEKIRQKKEDLNDADRTPPLNMYMYVLTLESPNNGKGYPPITSNCHENPSHTQRPSRQNIRHALGYRPTASRLRLTRRQTHHLGRLHHKQTSRHPPPIILGHDLCVRPLRKLCRLWRTR